MSEKLLPIQFILTLLTETPMRITALTAGLTTFQLHAAPDPGEWSVNDILAHLRSCADVWGGCIERIIAEERPTLRAVNPRTWIKHTDYPEQEFQHSLLAFKAQRAGLLAVLEPLPVESWSRSATVTGAGNILERTVQFYAGWLARHERSHLKPVERIVNLMRSAIGAEA
jgi:hypothetical protein